VFSYRDFPTELKEDSFKYNLWGTCSTPVRGVPYEPAAHALRPWYYTTSRGQRRVCRAKIEQVVARGGPSRVLLRGKGIENYSELLGMI
jgi:hypothetical protein